MNTNEFTIVAIETPTLGDRSYLVHDGEVAFVVDPQRDIDRVLDLLDVHNVRLTDVFETHIHNDYVTGGLALAQHTGAAYHVNAADEVSFERSPISDAQSIEVGSRMRVTALATPGHTFTHLAYALTDAASADTAGLDGSVGVFSGGSLLYGATGRPDLLGAEHTDALVRHQHASAHRLADLLPDEAGVFPTHGFGSFCSATQSEATDSTIGQERKANPVLSLDEETYVRELLDGLGAWPAYYVHMAPANTAGPSEPDLSLPALADATELRQRIEAGEWVVDLRNRTAFAAGHARGTLNFGLDGAFATYLGWLVTWGTPVTLLGETAQSVAEAQRELVRIGIDRPSAYATGSPQDWADGELVSFPTATFADLADVRHHRAVVVLDVRRSEEFADAAIRDAVNIPLHELWGRVDEVPAGEVWVHCAVGYRASVAASMLDAAGRRIVAIDDSFDNAGKVGLHLVGPEAA
jgi:hydroxyacylglutathione hydrolase